MATWTPTSTGNGTSLAVDSYGRTGTIYGSDPLDAANPEIIASDDTEVDLDFFGTGVHAYTKWTGGSDLWTQIGVVLQRTAGAFTGGAGAIAQVHVRLQFLLAAITDYSGGSAPLIALTGLNGNAAFAKIIVKAVLVSGSGTGSVWRFDVDWEDWDGFSHTDSSSTIPYASLNVGTTRNLILRVQCTSAGQTDPTVMDGSITLTLDGVALVDLDSIDPYIHWASGNPAVLNQWNRVGLGFAGLLGPAWMVTASDAFTTPLTVPVDESTPCCGGGAPTGGGSTGDGGPVAGGDPTSPTQPWTAQCAGGGTVPSEADPSASEAWA